jgi:hypothetical protein
VQDLNSLKNFYEKELLELIAFLQPNSSIWDQEIIGDFPSSLKSYNQTWIENLASISEHQEWDLDCERGHCFIPEGELKKLLDEVQRLKVAPRLEENLEEALVNQKYPSWALFQVSGKKQHEIKAICHFINSISLKGKSLLDIGGGKGHLARILALYHGFEATSIDTNEEFQKLGKERLAKYPHPAGHGSLTFKHHTLGLENQDEVEAQLFKNTDISIGLHTCGELAHDHISKARLGNPLLNIGCCYQRLSSKTAGKLSSFNQKNSSLELTKYALTLATRGHTDISLKDYTVKKRVKYYRAALQLFTNDKTGNSNFISVGSNHPRDYFKSFSDYALPKMEKLGISADPLELDEYYNSQRVQRDLDTIYRGNLVRWRFGRLIEKYIIYDRALSLVEKGHQARVFQIFDEKISPRNMAIAVY